MIVMKFLSLSRDNLSRVQILEIRLSLPIELDQIIYDFEKKNIMKGRKQGSDSIFFKH